MNTIFRDKVQKMKEEHCSSFYFCTDEIFDKKLETKYNIIIETVLSEEGTYVYKITLKNT